MVVFSESHPDAGGPSPADLIAYVEAMGRELADLCDRAGAQEAASRFRYAAEALAQPAGTNDAPGEAA